ncbi:MAG: agaA, partial [Pseudonocardiales bacterium]|nr:agaA [Pseudonocardiales bacterium]
MYFDASPAGRWKGRNMRISAVRMLAAAVLTLAALPPFAVASAGPAMAVGNGLAQTPPLGWNDWNAFGCNVSEALVEQTADAMVAGGMRDAGYTYVNIDDCWLTHSRDAAGNLVPDPVKFPHGIRAVADYVHARGLKLGIYEDAGTATCAGFPGSLGHETQDARLFASWTVDYLKYDNCNNNGIDPVQRYTAMRDALAASGRAIVYSLCNWGENAPWNWGPATGNLWRTTGDIADNWGSMLGIFRANVDHAFAAAPGGWNDPDMLEVGNGGMTDTEYRSHFTLWAAMAAPLIAGTDLRNASAATRAIYLNKAVIAVDQDSLGEQARQIFTDGTRHVLVKRLSGGDRAVVL